MDHLNDEQARRLRRAMASLEALPLRPATVRAIMDEAEADSGDLDPGWVLGRAAHLSQWELVASRSWWTGLSGRAAEAVERLWKHAVGTALAVRRLAEAVRNPDADRLSQIGLTHALGHWALAAIEPNLLADLLDIADPAIRRARERESLGTELSLWGRTLALRWRADPLLTDATWRLEFPDGPLDTSVSEPERLRLLRRARRWADRTPWSLGGTVDLEIDPRSRLWLMAEVQCRCSAPFLADDATPREVELGRRYARAQLQNERLREERNAQARFLQAFVQSGTSATAEDWPELARERQRPPTRPDRNMGDDSVDRAWERWSDWITIQNRWSQDFERLTAFTRDLTEQRTEDLERWRQEGLGEFAAGAGHELNNPLAVVLGRAQLLLARQPDAETVPSLKMVIAQARRAHRILRDLMYVARPPELRPRPCEPTQILRACVADLQPEATARGVRITCRTADSGPLVRADADGLRHLAEVLLRNALEQTPSGSEIRVGSREVPERIEWSVADSGTGIGEEEARKIWDPFYCGRQAGRGLGLGLPRAARFVAQCGGTLRWESVPGQGTTFHVSLPAIADHQREETNLDPDRGSGPITTIAGPIPTA